MGRAIAASCFVYYYFDAFLGCCCIAFDCWLYISGYMAFGDMEGREIQITTSSYISPLTPFSGAAGTSRAAHMIAFDCSGLIALREVRPF